MGRITVVIAVIAFLVASVAAIFGGISAQTTSDIDICQGDGYWLFQTPNNVTCSTPLGISEGKILIPCSDSTFRILNSNGTLSENVGNEGCGIDPDPVFMPDMQIIVGALVEENAIGAFSLNGSLIWKFDLEYGLPDVKIGLSDDDLIAFCDLKPTLHLLNSNGTEIWRKEINSIAWGPIFGDDIVVVLTDGPRIQAFSQKNGSLLWNDCSIGEPYSSYCGPSIGSDGTIYAAVGNTEDDPGYLCSYDQQGNVLWKNEIWGKCWKRLGQILISSDGEKIYLPLQRGIREMGPSPDYTKWLSEEVGEEILAYGSDGQMLWTGGYPGRMTFDNKSDVVYIYLDEVYALNDKGQIKWKFNIPIDGDYQSYHILTNINGTIYIGGTGLYDIGEGDHLWTGFVVALTSEPPHYVVIPIFPLLLAIILVPIFLGFLRVYWKK
ncbi:MAG: outer membrane protein assembly factor BamB family protein [Candidatus Thorarchaeota archaeon]